MMAFNRLQNDQIKPVALAFGVSAIAAIATMFVPVGLLETVTGATGISEMIPATAAPLGDTARAIIAFSAGAFMLIAALALLLRQEKGAAKASVVQESKPVDAEKPDRLAGLKARAAGLSLPKIALPKMPWTKNEDDILDLADLPKLRTFDAHPDAPARRPLSANNDLADATGQVVLTPEETKFWGETKQAPVEAVEYVAVDTSDPCSVISSSAAETETTATLMPSEEPSLAEMVAQLEAAVIQRKTQLAELEIIAAELAAGNRQPFVTEVPVAQPPADPVDPVTIEAIQASEILQPEELTRPLLEAVPSSPKADDDMDAALNAALETLHKMNAQAG
jgi:hypothetical protein